MENVASAIVSHLTITTKIWVEIILHQKQYETRNSVHYAQRISIKGTSKIRRTSCEHDQI